MEPVTQRTFRARLIERGIGDGRIGKARLWRGIRLRTDEDGVLSNEKDAKGDKTSGVLASKVTRDNHLPANCIRKEIEKKLLAKPVADVTLVTDDTKNDIPDYPIQPCQCGCGDYYLTDDNRWLCPRCHPKPREIDTEI